MIYIRRLPVHDGVVKPLQSVGEKFGDVRYAYVELLPVCAAANLHGASRAVEHKAFCS